MSLEYQRKRLDLQINLDLKTKNTKNTKKKKKKGDKEISIDQKLNQNKKTKCLGRKEE